VIQTKQSIYFALYAMTFQLEFVEFTDLSLWSVELLVTL